MTTTSVTSTVPFDQVPVRRFHWRVAIASATGSFADGYILGVSGVALAAVQQTVELSALWLGLLGSATLFGLFFGALVAGRLVDRFGRRPFYGPLMLVLSVLMVAQFWAEPDWSLLILRFVIGILLGGDYVASKALLSEYAPANWRGRAMSTLGIAWAVGFASAYAIGLMLRTVPDIGWSLILISASVPAGIVFFIRMGIPESPRWLVQTGRIEQAREIVTSRIGANVDLPVVTSAVATVATARPSLVRNGMLRNTFIACMAYAIATMPNFALGTFSPQVLTTLGVEDPYLGALGYNVCIAIGAFAGYFIIDRFGRKTLLFGGFLVAAALLAPMAFVVNLSPTLSVILFATFALIIVSTGNVVYAYPAELFPTEIRGRGVGLAVAASRLGSATVTFLLPILVASFGIGTALTVILGLLVFGGVVGFIWGPETAHRDLDVAARP